jgi:predicted transcriptional regulator
MSTATVRIPEELRDTLKVIASVEKREMKEILAEPVDDYIQRHRETLDLLSRPEWVNVIREGKEQVAKAVKGKSLDELKN